jgi:predicted dehydrogenase
MTFVGSKRMLVYDDLEPLEKIKIYDKRVEITPHYDTFAEFQYSYHYGGHLLSLYQTDEPLRAECQHFLDCIKTGSVRTLPVGRDSKSSRSWRGQPVLKNGGNRIEIDFKLNR